MNHNLIFFFILQEGDTEVNDRPKIHHPTGTPSTLPALDTVIEPTSIKDSFAIPSLILEVPFFYFFPSSLTAAVILLTCHFDMKSESMVLVVVFCFLVGGPPP